MCIYIYAYVYPSQDVQVALAVTSHGKGDFLYTLDVNKFQQRSSFKHETACCLKLSCCCFWARPQKWLVKPKRRSLRSWSDRIHRDARDHGDLPVALHAEACIGTSSRGTF